MGEEADDIVMSFGLTAEEAKQYNVVKGKFEAHFVVKRNLGVILCKIRVILKGRGHGN